MISRWKIYLPLALLLAAICVWNVGGQLREFTTTAPTHFPGNVGIGSTATKPPLNTLHVDGSVRFTNLTANAGIGNMLLYREDDGSTSLIGTLSQTPYVFFNTAAEALNIGNSGDSTILRLGSGNVTAVGGNNLSLGASGDYWIIQTNGLLRPSVTNGLDIGDDTWPVRTITSKTNRVSGSIIVGLGSPESGQIALQNSNGVGAAVFTHNGPSSASNIFNFAGITNPVAGQIFKIHSVSGNVVTVTNDTISSGVTTNGHTTVALSTTNVLPQVATNLAVNIAANEIWAVEFEVGTTIGGALAGIKFAVDVPTGATVGGSLLMGAGLISDIITADDTLNATPWAAAFDGWAKVAVKVANGSTAGTIQLKYAAAGDGTSSAAIATNRTYFTARRISPP